MKVVLIIHSSNGSEARRKEYDISDFEVEGTENIYASKYLILHLKNGGTIRYKYSRIIEITLRDGAYCKYTNSWFGVVYRIVLER